MNKDTSTHVWHNKSEARPAVSAIARFIQHNSFVSRQIKQTDWVLDLTVSGNSRYRVGELPTPWQERPAGVAHLYAPGTPYWEEYPAEELPVQSIWITFTGGETAGLSGVTGSDGYAVFADSENILRELLNTGMNLAREYGEQGFWRVQAVLMEVIALLLSTDGGTGGREISSVPDAPAGLPDMVREYLRGNLSRKVSLQDIADHCHISRSSLTHRYKEEAGETPWVTLQNLRIDRAKIMLARGERLQAIAEQAGFADEYHLSRTFKKITGVSPRRYIKRG